MKHMYVSGNESLETDKSISFHFATWFQLIAGGVSAKLLKGRSGSVEKLQ